jgi:hypothetical protein
VIRGSHRASEGVCPRAAQKKISLPRGKGLKGWGAVVVLALRKIKMDDLPVINLVLIYTTYIF